MWVRQGDRKRVCCCDVFSRRLREKHAGTCVTYRDLKPATDPGMDDPARDCVEAKRLRAVLLDKIRRITHQVSHILEMLRVDDGYLGINVQSRYTTPANSASTPAVPMHDTAHESANGPFENLCRSDGSVIEGLTERSEAP